MWTRPNYDDLPENERKLAQLDRLPMSSSSQETNLGLIFKLVLLGGLILIVAMFG